MSVSVWSFDDLDDYAREDVPPPRNPYVPCKHCGEKNDKVKQMQEAGIWSPPVLICTDCREWAENEARLRNKVMEHKTLMQI